MIEVDVLTRHEETFSSPNPFENPSPLNRHEYARSPRKKVAFVGFEEQNKQTAPLDDPEYDIWGFNMGNRLGIHADGRGRFRADRWFDLHEAHAQDAKDMAWINACPVPIFLTHDFGTNPLRVVYPLEWLKETIPGMPLYFCSSFALAFALAMAEGYTTIALHGVSLDWGRERVVERGNMEFWVGVALGRGINVHLGENSKLLSHPGVYGIEYDKEKQATKQICATLMRQLLQCHDVRDAFDAELRARVEALKSIADTAKHQVDRIVYQKVHL